MAANIFKLVGEIFVKNDEANKNIETTGKKADSLGDKLSKGIGTAAKWGAGIATAAGGAAAAMFGLAQESADSMDAIQKGAQKMGMSYENYQKLSYALDRSGASIDNLSKGMKGINKDLVEIADGNEKARETYDALGVAIYDADGNMRSAEEIMNDSLLALADMTNEAERNALANDLLGGSYTELIPFFESGSDGIMGLTQAAEDLGLVMSDDAVDAGAAFGDALADVKDSVGSVVTSFGNELLPVITQLLDWVKEHIPEIKEFIHGMLEAVQGFVDGVVAFVITLWGYIEPYLPIVQQFFNDIFTAILGFWEEHLKPLFEAIWGFISEVLIPGIMTIFDALKPFVETYIEGFKDFWNNGIKPIFTGIIDFLTGVFTGDWEKAWKGISSIFEGIANGLVTIIKTPLNLIIEGVNSVFGWLNTLKIPDWVPGLGGMGFHVDLLPKLAKGGEIIGEGQAIVGEAGAELIELPRGARVTPLNDNNNAFAETNTKLDKLTDTVSGIVAAISKMGVYIDGGALVGAISSEMDNSLGRLAISAGRSV